MKKWLLYLVPAALMLQGASEAEERKVPGLWWFWSCFPMGQPPGHLHWLFIWGKQVSIPAALQF